MPNYKKLVEQIAKAHCVSYMLTNNERYEKNEQRCGCVVHLARQMLAEGRVLYPKASVTAKSDASPDEGGASAAKAASARGATGEVAPASDHNTESTEGH